MNEFNSYYVNDYGWNPVDKCKANFFSKGPADQCCGEYPTRFPFNSEDGSRACCGTKTYTIGQLECCGDILVATGTCATPAPTTEPPCPCLNGGTCVQTGFGTTCNCAPGYTGSLCEWGPCNPSNLFPFIDF